MDDERARELLVAEIGRLAVLRPMDWVRKPSTVWFPCVNAGMKCSPCVLSTSRQSGWPHSPYVNKSLIRALRLCARASAEGIRRQTASARGSGLGRMRSRLAGVRA